MTGASAAAAGVEGVADSDGSPRAARVARTADREQDSAASAAQQPSGPRRWTHPATVARTVGRVNHGAVTMRPRRPARCRPGQ